MSQQNPVSISPSELFSALSHALDITEGQPQGHAVRCCWIGVHIGKKLSLDKPVLWELYYALLLKDTGCSSNAARLFQLYGSDDLQVKQDFKTVDTHKLLQVVQFIIKHTSLHEGRIKQLKRIANFIRNGSQLATELIQTRCERGASITKRLGFSQAVCDGVRYLDEHYDGTGKPQGLKAQEISLYSRIALVSQVADVFYQIGGAQEARKEVLSRKGTWFDPQVVDAFEEIAKDTVFWDFLNQGSIENSFSLLEPDSRHIQIDESYLDTVALAFADIIDAKSPFTFGHSTRVAAYADVLAKAMGIDQNRRRWFYRTSLLHDIGKLGVSNAILDKPGKLTDEEFAQIKMHPKHSEEILSKISVFKEMAAVAGAHHERLDGKGYHKGLKEQEICLETRILTLADIFDALSAKRPYRDALPLEKVFGILEEMRLTAVDGNCLDVFKTVTDQAIRAGLQKEYVIT